MNCSLSLQGHRNAGLWAAAAASLLLILSGCGEMRHAPPASGTVLAIRAAQVDIRIDTLEGGRIAVDGPSVLQLPERFVWGGSVIEGEDGRFHMLFNTFRSGPDRPKFSDGWVLHSEIGYAVSDRPDGEFEFRGIVLRGRAAEGDSAAWDAQMVTNPHVRRFAGRYHLYHVGSRDPGVQPPGSPGEDVRKRDRVQQMQRIGLVTFDTFEDLLAGRYERRYTPLLVPRTRVKPDRIVDPSPPGTSALPDNIVVVNPSVVRRPDDGRFLLFFKGNVYEPGWKGIHGVAIADAPDGPFTPLDQPVFDVRLSDGSVASAEDPFVWFDEGRSRFFAVVKDFTGAITGSGPALAFLSSPDGLAWSPARSPLFMRRELKLAGGRTVPVNRLERPHVLMDADGNPRVLYAACSIDPCNDKTDGGTFNVQIGIEYVADNPDRQP